jgi:class 3 adenylate cyclase
MEFTQVVPITGKFPPPDATENVVVSPPSHVQPLLPGATYSSEQVAMEEKRARQGESGPRYRSNSKDKSSVIVSTQSTDSSAVNPLHRVFAFDDAETKDNVPIRDGVDLFGKERLSHSRHSFEAGYECKSVPTRLGEVTIPTGIVETSYCLSRVCHRLLLNYFYQGVMLTLTIAILYMGDLFEATMDVQANKFYIGILYFCLAAFGSELVANVISSPIQTPRYVRSLFFYLDIIALLSIGFDLFITYANDLTANGVIARAARAARIGTRAGRSVRLMRMVRFVRLVRIMRVIKALIHFKENKLRKGDNVDNDVIRLADGTTLGMTDEDVATRADSIGAQIGAQTTKKVVIMVLLLLILIPILERDQQPHICSAEVIIALEVSYESPEVERNCTVFKEEVNVWFQPGSKFLIESLGQDSGLTRNGLVYAVIDRCVVFQDVSKVGASDLPDMDKLYNQRRSTEIQPVPCEANWFDADPDDRSATYFLYDSREENIEDASFNMGFTTLIIAILLGFSMIFSSDAEVISNQLVVPIRQLMKDMFYCANLELDEVTPIADQINSQVFEVRMLQGAFRHLYGAVGSFSKFTPLEVVRHFLRLGTEAQLGVTRRNISIFFSDIAGFTTICEGTQPVEVLALLSDYFECMVSVIVEQKGTMLEFIGDAILAIWNAPTDVPDHAVRAVTSALKMNQVLEGLRDDWIGQGKPEIRIRIGLHSADVYVGNLGSKMRMKYGVLGDGVNLASRLEELNKRYCTDILVSEDVLTQEGVRESFLIRPLDFVVVKGRSAPTRIYEVLDFQTVETPQLIRNIADMTNRAFEAYLDRKFDEAIQLFQEVCALKGGEDRATEVILDRCVRFLDDPPPATWDGADVLKSKQG